MMTTLTFVLVVLSLILAIVVVVRAFRIDGFTPVSHSYEPSESVFAPEGYNDMGQFRGFGPLPLARRTIEVGGIPREKLQEMYPVPDNFDLAM
jgi:hypothetical protein